MALSANRGRGLCRELSRRRDRGVCAVNVAATGEWGRVRAVPGHVTVVVGTLQKTRALPQSARQKNPAAGRIVFNLSPSPIGQIAGARAAEPGVGCRYAGRAGSFYVVPGPADRLLSA